MTRPPFPLFREFIETAFERRFEYVLRSAWRNRSWHVLVAEPGSGKSMGIVDVVRTAGAPSGTLSGRSYPILAVTSPKNEPKEQALGDALFTALRLPVRGRWGERKSKLMEVLVQFGVQCLIVDDAHDLSLEHLIFLKELTDRGKLPPYNHLLGLCLVTAGRGAVMPLQDVFEQPEMMWVQFRNRLDKLHPFCRIAGHSLEEVQEILVTLETVYRAPFPELNLRRWASSIYTWLTHPLLDPTNSGRVVMDYLMKLVTTALQWSYAAGETTVRAETLAAAAELLTLRRDAIWVLDGEPPTIEVRRSDTAEQESASGTERETAQENERASTTKTVETVKEQVQTSTSPKCTFFGVISIDLKRFADSGIALVECPRCSRTRSLSPVKGVLRFPTHDRRKIQTEVHGRRWVATDGKTDWEVVGGESKPASVRRTLMNVKYSDDGPAVIATHGVTERSKRNTFL